MIAAQAKLQVRYSETGAQGFVYHGNYYGWFDMAQQAFLHLHGFSYQQIMDSGVLLLPIDVKSRYYSPAYFGDALTVRMRVRNVSSIKITMDYDVVRDQDDKRIVSSTIVYACVDKEFQPLLFSKALPAVYAALRSVSEQIK